ncbi:type III secretion system chaperone [Aeromonas schubertii]|uniref:type III secretion system chaperone n=1 Tax=Aeromonas schubertii TaxID=652 RepID=UPI001D05572C|nr:type III secretion system chaperone [Aeromonas schubertii]
MDLTAAINGLLDAFGSRHGLTGLSLNAEGVAALCFDDTLRLSLILMPQWDQLVLQLDIAPCIRSGRGYFASLLPLTGTGISSISTSASMRS